MTLYEAFDAIETGMVSLDDKITISRKAQAEPPVKLGLRAEQTIKRPSPGRLSMLTMLLQLLVKVLMGKKTHLAIR